MTGCPLHPGGGYGCTACNARMAAASKAAARARRLDAALVLLLRMMLADAQTHYKQDKERVKMLQQALAELETV